MEQACGVSYAAATAGQYLPAGSMLFWRSIQQQEAWSQAWFAYQAIGFTPQVEQVDRKAVCLGEKPRTATGTASSSSAQISSLDAVASLSLGRLLPIGQKPRKVTVDAATQTAPSSSSSAQSMSLDKVEPGKKKRKKKTDAKRKKDLLAKNLKRCQKRREERRMKKAQA